MEQLKGWHRKLVLTWRGEKYRKEQVVLAEAIRMRVYESRVPICERYMSLVWLMVVYLKIIWLCTKRCTH